MRLIDATRIEQFILNNCSDTEEINSIYAELINAPTIDAVPVVTCGECEYADKYNHCTYEIWWNGNADFCSHGIPK